MSSGVRSYFCVWNNPQDIIIRDDDGNEIQRLPSELSDLEPQELCDSVLQTWVDSGKRSKRYGYVSYCISASGLHHLHMVLESASTIEFSSVKKVFPRAHISITRGSKKEFEDYVNKRGKYEEKGEEVVCYSQIGELKGNQGKRSDLAAIEEELALGRKPSEILGASVKRQRYASYIKAAYMAKRETELPEYRDVMVYWHYGASGSGKSYTYINLCKTKGRREVYKIERDLSRGRFDEYQGEQVLFIDELKPGRCDWVDLLNCMDRYIYHPSARYHNSVSLWEEVHVTSIYSPRQFWEQTFSFQDRLNEPFEQLARRIDVVVKHVREYDGTFHQVSEDPRGDLPFH